MVYQNSQNFQFPLNIQSIIPIFIENQQALIVNKSKIIPFLEV